MAYYKPPQYKEAKALIESCKGDDVAVYMGLGRKYPKIARLEADRIARLDEEMVRLREAAPRSNTARSDY